jgi:hypothetical protein
MINDAKLPPTYDAARALTCAAIAFLKELGFSQNDLRMVTKSPKKYANAMGMAIGDLMKELGADEKQTFRVVGVHGPFKNGLSSVRRQPGKGSPRGSSR